MKSLKGLFLISFFVSTLVAFSQTWIERTPSYPDGRKNTVGFTNGTYGFLVSGTTATDAALRDCWKYNPLSNAWSRLADFPGLAKRNHFSFVIDSFAFVGGGTTGSSERSDVFRYNMNRNKWDTLSNYPGQGRRNIFSASVGTKAYVGGGYSGTSSKNDFYEYNSQTDSWRQLPNLPFGVRSGGVSFSIADTVYFGTGIDDTGDFNDLWAYSVNDSTWRQKASLLGSPRVHANYLVINGKAVVGGGYARGTTTLLTDYYIYDPTTNQWSSLNGFVGDERSNSACFSVANKAYVFGGATSWTQVDGALWEGAFSGNSDSWIEISKGIPPGRANGVGFSNGSFGFLTLGNDANSEMKDCWRYNPMNNTWTRVSDFPGAARKNAVGVAIDTFAYVGLGYANGVLRSGFFRYNTVSDQWDTLASYPASGSRNAFIAAGSNGKIYIGGGMSNAQQDDFYEYDPNTNQWRQLNNLPFGNRATGTYFTIGDTIYFGMGFQSSNSYNDLWAYNVIDSTWTQKTSMPAAPRLSPEAFVVNGKAIVGGGFLLGTTTDLADYYEYDPATGNWTNVGTFSSAQRSAAASFSIGNVGYLCTGKDNSNNAFLNDIWSYNPLVTELEAVKHESISSLIYPNPSRGEIMINHTESGTLHLFHLNGKLIHTVPFNPNESIHFSSLDTGVYLYSIETDNSIERGKIVISK